MKKQKYTLELNFIYGSRYLNRKKGGQQYFISFVNEDENTTTQFTKEEIESIANDEDFGELNWLTMRLGSFHITEVK